MTLCPYKLTGIITLVFFDNNGWHVNSHIQLYPLSDLSFSQDPSYDIYTKTLTFTVKNIGYKTTTGYNNPYEGLYHSLYKILSPSPAAPVSIYTLTQSSENILDINYIFHNNLAQNEEKTIKKVIIPTLISNETSQTGKE